MQMLNIAGLKLLKICVCYCIRMGDGKEHNNKLTHCIRPWKGCLWSSIKILRVRERSGEQGNKIKRRAF